MFKKFFFVGLTVCSTVVPASPNAETARSIFPMKPLSNMIDMGTSADGVFTSFVDPSASTVETFRITPDGTVFETVCGAYETPEARVVADDFARLTIITPTSTTHFYALGTGENAQITSKDGGTYYTIATSEDDGSTRGCFLDNTKSLTSSCHVFDPRQMVPGTWRAGQQIQANICNAAIGKYSASLAGRGLSLEPDSAPIREQRGEVMEMLTSSGLKVFTQTRATAPGIALNLE